MANEIDKILIESNKAELLEVLGKELVEFDKGIFVLIQDKEGGKYRSLVITLGLKSSYEAYGILEVARQDLGEQE